jgi:hypothetical protein
MNSLFVRWVTDRIKSMQSQLEFFTQTVYDPAIFWSMIAALASLGTTIATGLLVYYAAVPIRRLVKDRKTELAWRLHDSFLTPRVRAILFLIDHNILQYQKAGGPHFSFATIDEIDQLSIRAALGDVVVISIFEVDDAILNRLEEVALREYDKSLEFQDIYEIFGNFIGSTMNNKAIKEHIEDVRSRPNAKDAWTRLELIVPRLKKHDDETH